MRWLFRAAALRHHQDPTIAELVAAEVAILCFSVGGILVTLGGEVFDRVELSARWISWPCAAAADRRLPARAFVVVPDDALIATLARMSACQGQGHRRGPWDAGGDHATL